jgi:hypothetical protein
MDIAVVASSKRKDERKKSKDPTIKEKDLHSLWVLCGICVKGGSIIVVCYLKR